MCYDRSYLDTCLGFIDLSLKGHFMLTGQLPLLAKLILQKTQLLLQT